VDFLGRATSFTSPLLPNPVQHPEVQLFLRGVARTLGKQVDKAEPCTLEHLKALNMWALSQLQDVEAQCVTLIATLAFWGCLRLGALIPKREEKKRQCLRLQNLEVRGTSIIATVHISKTIQFGERQHRIEVPAQSDQLLCPLESIDALDLRLATPIIPDPIVRAVHDQSYNAVSFAIPDPCESHCPFNQPSLGSLVPSGLRSSGIRSQCANMASDASRRLEDSGSGHVVCRGRAHSKPTGRPVEPRPVREGWFPPD
jgi:hypothetical protein